MWSLSRGAGDCLRYSGGRPQHDFDNSLCSQDWVSGHRHQQSACGWTARGRPWSDVLHDVRLLRWGRCRCNGHAARCIHDRDGLLVCDCKHNCRERTAKGASRSLRQ
ncbi:hypothetical protein AVEN_113770-1 [Araneus ventricosus]|uniref:Uncharacterized protein n=1 Tax=Araneus ventricosus TaxID=182803 RepID=A0A4Y2N8B6_ARAVE|nr:hypothetical protein AVEN_113770-1 [Araneus ventricosus]